MAEQVPFDFGAAQFAENPEPRVPCVLLLDVSLSMAGRPIEELAAGLETYRDELAADSLASKRVEVAIVTFGGDVAVPCDFTTAKDFRPPEIAPKGDTPMGEAILRAVEMVRVRKDAYRTHGIMFYRPWIFLITDGGPTDAWKPAALRVREGEESKAFSFFGVGVEGANFDVLREICVRAPLKLKGLRFRDLFQWLSNSQQSVSRSTPGEDVVLVNPTGPDGWAIVGT